MIPSDNRDPALYVLYLVGTLRISLNRTQNFRRLNQLFFSKDRMSHWIVNAILMAFQAHGLPAHSIRGVTASLVLANGVSLADISRAAGWATHNTVARFYNLRLEPVLSLVLGTQTTERV